MNKIFLLYGEEDYLINEKINEIKSDYLSYDCIKYDMMESNISEALEDASMGSLFSLNKIIVCYNCFFLTGVKCEIEHKLDDLSNYVKHDSDNILILAVTNNSLDNRKSIIKELKNKAEVIEYKKLKGFEINNFIKNYCKKSKYTIENDAINLLINKLTDNLNIITMELEKLFVYKNDGKITKDDVDICTSKLINTNIFDLIDSIVKNDTDRSMELYDDLLLLNEEEIKLIIILANQFRLIYQVKTMYKGGYSEYNIASLLGINPYRIKLANESAVSETDSLIYLRKLGELDRNIKTGKINKKVGFEKFILGI